MFESFRGLFARKATPDPRVVQLERQLAELVESIDLSSYVDPLGAIRDEQGGYWNTVAMPGYSGSRSINDRSGFRTETELTAARDYCRRLAEENSYALNAIENRISYIVGVGHSYKAVPKAGEQVDPATVLAVQKVIDDFTFENRWSLRQQESLRRLDRDGEVFLRFFPDAKGSLKVRFVEPWQVQQPAGDTGAGAFGVQTDPDDVETVEGYWVDGEFVAADEVQHRKANVDLNVRRGMPTIWPVRFGLLRVEKIERNMTAVSEIQSSIALIRKHTGVSKEALGAFRNSQATASVMNNATGQTNYVKQFQPGAIIDTYGGVEYEMPSAGIDASKFVMVQQAVLRSVASRLCLPEFMLTSNAANANYSSTLVAEGPAVKNFERWQESVAQDDLRVMWLVLNHAVRAGKLGQDVLDAIEIQVGKPTVQSRNLLQEAQTNQILHQGGVLSLKSWSAKAGLEYDQEQANKKSEPVPAVPAGGPVLPGAAVGALAGAVESCCSLDDAKAAAKKIWENYP